MKVYSEQNKLYKRDKIILFFGGQIISSQPGVQILRNVLF